eukprot:11016231-Lingulodinium_polyedra.AAC.1
MMRSRGNRVVFNASMCSHELTIDNMSRTGAVQHARRDREPQAWQRVLGSLLSVIFASQSDGSLELGSTGDSSDDEAA